ncbi:uncharacterized protein LOC110860962 [Folsomia candida]|uniref:uncharacterized protein LOC110860962 n=1 Tax=Folsomia candida TaxID=158441 RepID=UPI000B8F14DF|nr:uncharacterized protein LOC110860962 [Folsomia candida]
MRVITKLLICLGLVETLLFCSVATGIEDSPSSQAQIANNIATQMLDDVFEARHKPAIDALTSFDRTKLEDLRDNLINTQAEKVSAIQTKHDEIKAIGKEPGTKIVKDLDVANNVLKNLNSLTVDAYC